MRPASARLVINSAHAVSLEELTRTSSRVKKSSCGVADHLEFTEDPELPARGVLRGDLSASKISSADYAVTTLPRKFPRPFQRCRKWTACILRTLRGNPALSARGGLVWSETVTHRGGTSRAINSELRGNYHAKDFAFFPALQRACGAISWRVTRSRRHHRQSLWAVSRGPIRCHDGPESDRGPRVLWTLFPAVEVVWTVDNGHRNRRNWRPRTAESHQVPHHFFDGGRSTSLIV